MTSRKRWGGGLFAAIVAIVMAFAMLPGAALAAGNATITINKSGVENDWAGLTVNAYKVFDEVTPAGGNTLYTVDQDFKDFFNINGIRDSFNGQEDALYLYYDASGNMLKTIASSVEGGFRLSSRAALDATYPEADLMSRITGGDYPTGEAATFYTWLEKYITAKNDLAVLIVEDGSASAETGNNSMTISSLEDGYYALVFSNVPSGINVKQGILVKTNATSSATVTLKAEDIPFQKQVVDYTEDLENPGLQWSNTESGQIGDKKTYMIENTVPTLADYSSVTEFSFTDTLDNQKLLGAPQVFINDAGTTVDAVEVTYNEGTQTYTIPGAQGGSTVTIASLTTMTDYDEVTNTGTFKIEFVPSVISQYQGKDVVVYYHAQITEDAAKVNGNEATLVFDRDPDKTTLTDSTEVYTYGIKIQKKFSDGTTDYSAVKFQLFAADGSTPIKLTGSDGVYNVAADQTGATAQDLSLASDGTLTITGLDDDVDYTLKETDTASGYNTVGDIVIDLAAQDDPNGKLLDEATTKITVGGTEATLSFVNNASPDDDAAIAIATFDVLNQKGFTLPTTGGAGTWALTIGGIVLVGAAATMLVVSRKKGADQQ